MEIRNSYYVAKVENGLLTVKTVVPPRAMKYSSDGTVSVVKELDSYCRTQSLFSATADPEEGFHCDISCGVQRWNGWKSARDLGKALSRCGFSGAERRQIFKELRKSPRLYCPSHW